MKCFRWGMPWYQPKRRKSIPQKLYLLACFTKTTTNKQFYMEIVHDDNEIDAKKAEKITRIFRDLKSNKFFLPVFVFYLPFFPIWICWRILNNNIALNIICLFSLAHWLYIFFLVSNSEWNLSEIFHIFQHTHNQSDSQIVLFFFLPFLDLSFNHMKSFIIFIFLIKIFPKKSFKPNKNSYCKHILFFNKNRIFRNSYWNEKTNTKNYFQFNLILLYRFVFWVLVCPILIIFFLHIIIIIMTMLQQSFVCLFVCKQTLKYSLVIQILCVYIIHTHTDFEGKKTNQRNTRINQTKNVLQGTKFLWKFLYFSFVFFLHFFLHYPLRVNEKCHSIFHLVDSRTHNPDFSFFSYFNISLCLCVYNKLSSSFVWL